MSIQTLEELLAQRRLQDEQQLLTAGSIGTNAVTVTGKGNPNAVGPTLYLPVKIGGVPAEALVDTGTIISRVHAARDWTTLVVKW